LALIAALLPFSSPADPVDSLVGKKTAFLGDSITQAGTYIGFTSYYLQKLHPSTDFDFYSLGLASETLSGLSEKGHAGGRFPRPHLFERLGRLLEIGEPEVVFACYGINCGIYQPLDDERFAAFKSGVNRLISDCRAAGVEEIFLVTPPIYDLQTKDGEFNYDEVMTAYAAWQTSIEEDGVTVIDLHTAMREARDERTKPFSGDRIHPGPEGHLFMARTILAALGVEVPVEQVATVQKDPLFQKIERRRKDRGKQWMNHIGYTRSKRVEPQPLGTTEEEAAQRQLEIDRLRQEK
jgi:lysophospholipase L1-like esterase